MKHGMRERRDFLLWIEAQPCLFQSKRQISLLGSKSNPSFCNPIGDLLVWIGKEGLFFKLLAWGPCALQTKNSNCGVKLGSPPSRIQARIVPTPKNYTLDPPARTQGFPPETSQLDRRFRLPKSTHRRGAGFWDPWNRSPCAPQ